MPISLTVREGPHAGQVFQFDGHDTFLVGRAPEAHFHLPDDPYFSRMHLLIEVNPPLCRLTDLGSRNGTLVNDKKVQTVALKNGDTIRGGKTLLHVAIVGQEVAATLELGGVPAAMPAPVVQTVVGDAPTVAGGPHTIAQKSATFPTILGFRIEQELGSGAMGVVYRAIRECDGIPVALKTIKPAVAPTDTVVKRFLREANILKQLDHRNIVRFHDMGSAAGLLWFAMEFVPGTDADHFVKESGPLPIRQAVELMADVLDALGYAHQAGFIHRDLKPANLLVFQNAGRTAIKLADFGLARAYQSSSMSGLTIANQSGGTPLFMPPEQITDFRNVKPAADQYSAAATLYYLLTGKGPHQATSVNDLFKKILLEEPTPVRSHRLEASGALDKAIQRALSRKPEERYPDVRAFRKEIAQAV